MQHPFFVPDADELESILPWHLPEPAFSDWRIILRRASIAKSAADL